MKARAQKRISSGAGLRLRRKSRRRRSMTSPTPSFHRARLQRRDDVARSGSKERSRQRRLIILHAAEWRASRPPPAQRRNIFTHGRHVRRARDELPPAITLEFGHIAIARGRRSAPYFEARARRRFPGSVLFHASGAFRPWRPILIFSRHATCHY